MKRLVLLVVAVLGVVILTACSTAPAATQVEQKSVVTLSTPTPAPAPTFESIFRFLPTGVEELKPAEQREVDGWLRTFAGDIARRLERLASEADAELVDDEGFSKALKEKAQRLEYLEGRVKQADVKFRQAQVLAKQFGYEVKAFTEYLGPTGKEKVQPLIKRFGRLFEEQAPTARP